MDNKEYAEICVTSKDDRSGWRMTMAKNILKRYRDITFEAVSGINKIEHNGHVMYTLVGPPLKSPVNRKRMRHLYKDILSEETVIENNQVIKWGQRTPHIVSIATNYECQCRCKHCCSDNFRHIKPENYLSKDEIISIMNQACDMGATTFVLGGGEALLRNDIDEIVASLDQNKATITLFTNGEFLTEDMVQRLKQSGIYGIFVSIDSAIPERHDNNRERPGLFHKAVEGIRSCIKYEVPVGISTVCTRENIDDGDLRDIIEFGKELNVFEIFVLDIVPTGRMINEEEKMLSTDEISSAAGIIEKYTNDSSYPNIIHESMLFKLAYPCVMGCAAATVMMHIRANGKVSPCDFMPLFFGDTREEPLADIWQRMTTDDAFQDYHKTCRMTNVEFREKYINNAAVPIA